MSDILSKRTGSAQATMQDVADMAGVSRMTVSRALKKNSSVSKRTRDHILKIAKNLNFVPNQMAAGLSTQKSGFIGLILPSLNNLHFAMTVRSLTEEIESLGLQLLFGDSGYSVSKEEQIVETMLRHRPEAMVLSYDGHSQRTVQLLKNAAIPIVEIWETPETPIQHTVGFSNSQAAFDMTSALVKKGFKNIVFLGEADDEWTRGAARREGFEQAMREAGYDPNSSVRFGTPPLTIESGAAAVELVIEKFPDVDCIFCVSDIAAFGAQSHLLHLGVAVPDQISVVGFGNFDVSRFSSPTISTVVVDPIQIGRETGRIIREILCSDAPNTVKPRHILTVPALKFRASSSH